VSLGSAIFVRAETKLVGGLIIDSRTLL